MIILHKKVKKKNNFLVHKCLDFKLKKKILLQVHKKINNLKKKYKILIVEIIFFQKKLNFLNLVIKIFQVLVIIKIKIMY